MHPKKIVALIFLVACLFMGMVIPAGASPVNLGPPVGAILDLNGTPIPGNGDGATVGTYSVAFTASLTQTAITFAFRDDPGFIFFENASVVDQTSSGGNLLINGDFSLGGGNGWTQAAQAGIVPFGGPSVSCGAPSPTCWSDETAEGYDAISQTIATTVGDSYLISFDVLEGSGLSTFSALSTNGESGFNGNGIDVLAYAQAGPALAGVPEPAPACLFMTGLGGLGLLLVRKRR